MPVNFHQDGNIGIITLASPQKRNALSRDIVGGVLDILGSAIAAEARAIVVTGDGAAFCAGADIGDLLDAGWIDGTGSGPDPIDLFERIARDPRPVIAAVNGLALGGGFELMLSCDLAIAGEDAVFAMPELGLGVIPNTALWRLTQLVGVRTTMELAATGRRLTATEAASLRLVNAVVPAGTALAAAIAMAAKLVARVPPGAFAALKRGLAAASPTDWPAVRAALSRIPPAEWQEGLGAFAAKRKPEYDRFWRDHAHRTAIQDL